ncbi:hypothetical protein [Salinimicrobium sp. HB62]|nr:hypothetical protein [Salinimicrobium sp. HB62]
MFVVNEEMRRQSSREAPNLFIEEFPFPSIATGFSPWFKIVKEKEL